MSLSYFNIDKALMGGTADLAMVTQLDNDRLVSHKHNQGAGSRYFFSIEGCTLYVARRKKIRDFMIKYGLILDEYRRSIADV